MANNAQVLLPSEIESSCIDELSRGFGSSTFPEPNQENVASEAALNLAPNPEGSISLAGYDSISITRPAPPTPNILSGCGPYGAGPGVCVSRPKLTNQYLFVNPAQPQESSKRRASPGFGHGMMQWRQNQLLTFGLVGASRGTGVFHPQPGVAPVNTTNKIIRNKREIKNMSKEATPRRNSSKLSGGLEKKQLELEECLSDHMALPKEWTY
ncbi:hypothetical protein L6164_009556 [Bauhinia variegata]|uniref:Uncharacterized protein n=1 Tax=Bauhinia variegata TaxID=167791 RepID=A0ACB9PQN8_BAUVA|nr:hypothetical protein L6164_009556 [Bauhinia variegata]